jgi:hypothetical protein
MPFTVVDIGGLISLKDMPVGIRGKKKLLTLRMVRNTILSLVMVL